MDKCTYACIISNGLSPPLATQLYTFVTTLSVCMLQHITCEIVGFNSHCFPPLSTSAPPLTVDSVLAAVQGVKWRTVGEMLLVFAYKVDKIGQQYKSDDDRLHAVVTTWLQGDRKDVEPSWRLIIWRLDHANQTKAADKIRDFAEPVLGKL